MLGLKKKKPFDSVSLVLWSRFDTKLNDGHGGSEI